MHEELHICYMLTYIIVYAIDDVQGDFFDWSALKLTKYEEKLEYLDWSANCSSRKVLSVNPK